MKTQVIDIKKIVIPENNNPRKMFSADKLAILARSIKAHGLKQPLTVEDTGNGTYRLVNGERRYRAATYLKLKELPCIVEAPMDDMTRLITQFHIQDEHEDWSPAEKAEVICRMSEDFKLPIQEVCRLLNIDRRMTAKFMAFAKIIDKESFSENEIPLAFSEQINTVKLAVRRAIGEKDGKAMTKDTEKAVEDTLIMMIKSGAVRDKNDLIRIKDACNQDIKSVNSLIDGTAVSAQDMWKKSNALGAYSLRNMLYSGSYMANHARNLLKEDSIKPSKDQIAKLKDFKKVIESVIAEYDGEE